MSRDGRMNNKIMNLSSKLRVTSIVVAIGVAIAFALATHTLQNQTNANVHTVSDKDRASLAYPILKRRGPLTRDELARGAAPVIIKHRSIQRSQANGKPLEHNTDF